MTESNIYWDDLRISATMFSVGDSLCTKPPGFVPVIFNSTRGSSYSGIYAWKFDHGRDGKGLFQNAYFHTQLPHSYCEGTPLEPHLHAKLEPRAEGRAGQRMLLELEYTWTNIGEKAPSDTTILSLNHTVTEKDLDCDNIMIIFPLIAKKEAKISSMLSCRFSRITIDPSWKDFWTPEGLFNDSFEGSLIIKEFDFHFMSDSPGSADMHHKNGREISD